MSVRTDVLLWAQRVVGRAGAPAHLILEIAGDASLETAQEAFHKIARLAHPDLHRTTLSPEELELVTTAYARAAAAYQEIRLRCQKLSTARLRPVRDGSDPALVPPPPAGSPAKPAEAGPAAAPAMTAKAQLYYRKAELCLRRGELTEAVLQLKMAIASDPQSAFLRSALAQVQSEIGKKP
jgi:hypothetical protein